MQGRGEKIAFVKLVNKTPQRAATPLGVSV